MAKFWRTPDFQELNKQWNEKLKKSGFDDAEEEVGGEKLLKQRASYAYRRRETTAVQRQNKLEYFMLIAQFIEREKGFEDESDKLIMQRTAEGLSIREISEELQRLKKPKFNRDTIRYIRRRYEHRWGIRFWSKEAMVSRRVRTR